MFLTSHVLEIVEKLCTDVAIIVKGRLAVQAPMADIRRAGTLEEHFLAAAGNGHTETQKLSWLEE